MSSVLKNYRKIYTSPGGDPSLPPRVTILENNEYKVTYYEVIQGASGTLVVPSQGTINSDEFGLSGNAILSKIDANNKPTYESPTTVSGAAVTASLNVVTGAWVASGVYTDPNVALIYSIRIKAIYYSNLTYDNIIETANINGAGGGGTPTLAQVLASGNTTAGIQIQSDGFVSALNIVDSNIDLIGDGGEVYISNAKTLIYNDNLIELNAPSVLKNGVEIATVNDIPTKTSELINDGDDGNPFISLNDLPSNLILYATNKASDVPTYVKLVSSITDIDYNTTAVDVSTGSITTTNQFISSLITSSNVIVGNPGVLNITTIGNIRRTAGTGDAEFYFEVYKRTIGGVETLITTSGNTPPVFNGVYAQFSATALWNDGIFLATDRIVLKFYGSRIVGGSAPTYDFQFGGSIPVRSLVPIPLTVSPTPLSELIINKQDSLAVDGTATKYPTVDAVNAGLATKGVLSYLDQLVFSGSYMPAKKGYGTTTGTAGLNSYLSSQRIDNRKTCIITSLSVYCNVGVAGGNVRISIWSDLNGLPNTLLVDSGNIACTSAGRKEGTITPFTMTENVVYHIGVQVSSATINLAYYSVSEKTYYNSSTSNYVLYLLASYTYGTPPATFPAITFYYDSVGFAPYVLLKQQ
jgi:hypothetical protein